MQPQGWGPPRGYSRIGRLSGPAHAAPARLERERWEAGAVEVALRRWESIARAPGLSLPPLYRDRCGQPACCPEPAEARDVPERAVHALPTRAARELLLLVRVLDEEILRRRYLVPAGGPPHRWWESGL
ncbi:hypothetical protein [Kitasatospora phosalacinea]|uniref:hypothetical protein n=1 Tax=Kitasatospora phosalacinea TaxID=2065 RepID=UPI00068976BB|nr:hypothetical protein [Kitasatospora phosalacinea]